MNLIKILNSITRILGLMLVLIIIMIVFLAANYEPQLEGDLVDPEVKPTEQVNLYADDPGYLLFDEWDCDNCHEVNSKKVGPALAGVPQRRKKNWLYQFIQNSQKLIGKGDPTAVALYEEHNKLPMPIHDLEPDQIDLILAYIEKAAQ